MVKNNEMVVVNLDNYTGNIQAVLYDGINPYYPERGKEYYLEKGFSILTRNEYSPIHEKHLDSLCGEWREITEEKYNEAMNVLPPLRYENGGFFMREMWTADVTDFYQQIGRRYFTSMQRLKYDRLIILKELRESKVYKVSSFIKFKQEVTRC